MMNLNYENLTEVVRDALSKVSNNRRWGTAIAKAEKQIESNPFFILTARGFWF